MSRARRIRRKTLTCALCKYTKHWRGKWPPREFPACPLCSVIRPVYLVADLDYGAA